MGTTDDGSGRTRTATSGEPKETQGVDGTKNAAAAAGGGSSKARINHMPGAGTARAEAVNAGRREMLSDTLRKQIKSLAERGVKRPRIGADAVCEALLAQGVDVFFGYPGGVLLPLYDVLGDYPELRHILVRHEQGAAHAADGYARASGRVGVCLGTSGPGATNLVTGIGNAMLDSVPMVAITGNVISSLLGKDAFQEIDITGITLPCTKHNYLVSNPNDIPRVFAEAFHIAATGRPGPVHIDITKDALMGACSAEHPATVDLPGFKPNFEGNFRQIKLAAQEIARAERPVILAGHGVLISDATEELREFAEKAQIPVAHTLLGVSAMDETHPLSLGWVGMHGWKHVNRAIQSADLLIALGMRFDDRVTGHVPTFAPYARIIHVDIDPAEIGKNVAVEIPIVGDVKRVLTALLPLVPAVESERRAAYLNELAEWRLESEKTPWHGSGAWRNGQLSADFVVCKIGEATNHDATIVADVGQNQMWTARYAGFRRPNSHISAGGLGPMGFGLPAAMGAAMARPDKETWAIVGDGGLQMTVQELMTLVQDHIPVKIALLDNHKLGMIRQWQELIYAGNYHSSHLLGPDWLKLAEAYGVAGFRASTPEEVEGAIAAAQAVDGPALVHFMIAEEQNVFPMMPAGKGLSDLLEEQFEEPKQ
ncbi:MAG TPA: biosynthetic-type acetolactate synthase large subunit [Candidatus Limnocylindrales bacterium]|jgi:acetolactate synthase-1/2/3 large subunit